MDIGRTEGVQGPGRVEGPKRTSKVTPPQAPASAPADKVEISDAAQLISRVASIPQVRQDRIDEVKKLIESGKFETKERMQGAIENFLNDNRDLIS